VRVKSFICEKKKGAAGASDEAARDERTFDQAEHENN